jgi:regulator of replication initiation timing
MEKRISYSQFQQVKSAAKMIDPNMRKIESLKKKIMPLVEEMKYWQAQNDSLEEGIVKFIGFHVSDLVKKVIEPTGTTDKNGKAIMTTKYLPTDIVSYDEQKKQYVICVPDEGQNAPKDIVPPTTADGPGSDFDADKQNFQEKSNVPEEQTVGQDANMPWNN